MEHAQAFIAVQGGHPGVSRMFEYHMLGGRYTIAGLVLCELVLEETVLAIGINGSCSITLIYLPNTTHLSW